MWKENMYIPLEVTRKPAPRRGIWQNIHRDGRMLEMSAQNSLLCFEVREGVSWKKRAKQKARQYTMGFAMLGGHVVSGEQMILVKLL